MIMKLLRRAFLSAGSYFMTPFYQVMKHSPVPVATNNQEHFQIIKDLVWE